MTRTPTALIALLTTLPLTAQAQDLTVYGGAALEYLNRPDGPGEPDRTSIEGYIEGELSGFYAGAWVRKADNSDFDRVDLYLGYRNDLDSGLAYDLGYYRYGYPSDRDSDYGEVYFTLGQTLDDTADVSLTLAYDPDNKLGNAYGYFDYYLSDKWTIGAVYGVYEVADAGSEREWELGATYSLTDTTGVDLRWYDGSEYVDGYLGLRLQFDTTILGG